jgi:hypothetical protein
MYPNLNMFKSEKKKISLLLEMWKGKGGRREKG